MTSVVILVGGGTPDRAGEAALAVARNIAASDAVSRAVVSIADVDPGDAVWVRPGETASKPPHVAVIELTVRSDKFNGVLAQALAALVGAGLACDAYRVTRLVERGTAKGIADGTRSPGTRYFVLCNFHPDMPPSAARRSWDHHVPLALRVHTGAARYVRSWIEEVLTPGSPAYQGMTELYFLTEADMRERWFPTPELRAQIVQDIGHFLDSGVRLYTSEYVLRDGGPA